MKQMYNTKTSVMAETEQLTYTTLSNLSLGTGIPLETLAGRAMFLGLEYLIKEIVDTIHQDP